MNDDLMDEVLRRTAQRAVETGRDKDPVQSVSIAVTIMMQVMLERDLLNDRGIDQVQEVIQTYGQTH